MSQSCSPNQRETATFLSFYYSVKSLVLTIISETLTKSMIEVIFNGNPEHITISMPEDKITTITETITEASELMPTTSHNLFTTYYVFKQ